MANRIHKISKAFLSLCWLGAGAGCADHQPTQSANQPTQSASRKPLMAEAAKPACATLAMATKGLAAIDIKGPTLLEIPSTLQVHGHMTGGAVLVDFNRPEYGNLECRYEQESDGALTLRSCAEDASHGDWVTTDRMSVKLAGAPATVSQDATITACAAQRKAPVLAAQDPAPSLRTPTGQLIDDDYVSVPLQPDKFGMTGELETEYRAIAAKNASVIKLLGARFAYSYLDIIDPPKGQERDSIHVKLWFFSHTNTKSVWVTIKDGVVEEAGQEDFFVPEGREEVEAAVALARQDSRLAGRLNDLEGGGMLAVSRPDSTWLGNRVIEVHFGGPDHVAQFRALVDLTNERVLEAGVQGSNQN